LDFGVSLVELFAGFGFGRFHGGAFFLVFAAMFSISLRPPFRSSQIIA